ncbi:MAG: dTDP-4-dehydrorhamnose 3,5-epimerase [Bacteroidetes bacterium]|nr:dTDP-4-dehydrorhamnose 3,5-epimerase [Bacteroidota bacterium]
MIFESLDLKGAYLIKPELHEDERGFFARSFCKKEFQEQGLINEFIQCNISYNKSKGTLRGMHYQLPPHEEIKLVRCTKGSIYDVIVDLRKNSPTRGKWLDIEINEDNRHMIYIPEGFAHGYISLVNDTEVFYQMSTYYDADSVSGFCWNDPVINIKWPIENIIVSEKDQTLPSLEI